MQPQDFSWIRPFHSLISSGVPMPDLILYTPPTWYDYKFLDRNMLWYQNDWNSTPTDFNAEINLPFSIPLLCFFKLQPWVKSSGMQSLISCSHFLSTKFLLVLCNLQQIQNFAISSSSSVINFVYMPLLLYPLFCYLTLGLLLELVYCKYHCNEHKGAYIFLN